MPVRTISTRIAITGETEYRQALTRLNREQRVLQSELTKTQSAFKDSQNSMEALTAKGKILAFYEGDLEKKQIVRAIGTRLPGFMIPNVFVKVEEFPLTKNGKIDRKKLEETYESGNLTSLS